MDSDLELALSRLVTAGALTSEQALAVTREVAAVSAQAPVPVGAGAPAIDQPAIDQPAGGRLPPGQPTAGPRPAGWSTPGGAAERPAWAAVIAEIGGYVGGAFVLAAAVVLTGPRWGDFDTTQRIAILGVPAVILLAAAVAILITTPGGWPIHDRRGAGQRRRLSAAFVLVGAALCGGIAVAGWDGSDRWDGVRFTVAALAVLAAGYASCRTLPLHVATAGVAAGLAGSAATAVVDNLQREELWAGLGLLGVAAGWLVLSLLGVLDEAALGLTVSGVIAFVGGEMISTQDLATWLGFLALGLLAAAGLVGYVRTRHVGVLVVGVVALATVVPQAVIHYTEGALGAAGALLLVGLSILGASVLGLRLRSGSR